VGLAEIAVYASTLTVCDFGFGEVLQVLLEGPAFSLRFGRHLLV